MLCKVSLAIDVVVLLHLTLGMQLLSGCRQYEDLASAAQNSGATLGDIGQAARALVETALGRLMR